MPRTPYINKFPEGLDKDSDDKIRKNTTYKDAHHIVLTGDGKYGGVQNMKGTTLVNTVVSTITYGNINVMGAYKARTFFSNTTTVEDAIFIFYGKNSSGTYTFNISVYRPGNTTRYDIYSKTLTTFINPSNPSESYYASKIMTAVMDAFVIGEGGIDTLYYTIPGIPLGRIRCVVNVASPIKLERQTELLKRYPSNGIVVNDIIYNPKSEAAASATHTISYSPISDTTSTYVQYYSADSLLDVDITAGDQFWVDFYWQITTEVGSSATAYADINIKFPKSGSSIAGFPKSIATGSGPDSHFSNGVERINITSAPYNTDPIWFEIRAEIIPGGDTLGLSEVECSLTGIGMTAGGDTYLRGSVVSKTVLREIV